VQHRGDAPHPLFEAVHPSANRNEPVGRIGAHPLLAAVIDSKTVSVRWVASRAWSARRLCDASASVVSSRIVRISDAARPSATARSSAASASWALGRRGLTLEGSDLTANLPKQITKSHETAFGCLETAHSTLARRRYLRMPAASSIAPRRFFGSGGKDAVELALGDDRVLLAADPSVGEQLLDVEKTALDAVSAYSLSPLRKIVRRNRDLVEIRG